MQSQQNNRNIPPSPLSELLWTLSTQAIFCSFSPQVGRILGWSDTDWIGKPLASFVHPYDILAIKARYRDVLAGETARFEDIRCLAQNGSHVAWALSFVPQMESGIVTEVLVLGHLAVEGSIPERPTMHPLSALRFYHENETRPSSAIIEYAGLAKLLEGMLGNAPIGFALLDAELRLICLNQTFSEMTSFSPSQQLGQPLRGLLPKAAELVEPVMQSVLATGKSVLEYEAELQKASGSDPGRYAEMSFYPIPDLHGGVCGVATIAVDVSERKRSEAKLRKTSDELLRSNHALAEFSYIASHDLKEPLRTINSFARLLKKSCEGTRDQEYITFMLESTQRMHRLIEKLLEYSKAGKVEGGPTDVDCTSMLRIIVSTLNVTLEESGARVTYDSLPTVRGDESLLTQVFQNLIANAIKYRGDAPPTIHISAKRELDTWVFSVADNGIGISSDQFLNVFAPFKKLHSQSEYPGSGLGLAICQKNVERQGGSIWVTSEVGKGSVFYFTIPATVTEGHAEHENFDRFG